MKEEEEEEEEEEQEEEKGGGGGGKEGGISRFSLLFFYKPNRMGDKILIEKKL